MNQIEPLHPFPLLAMVSPPDALSFCLINSIDEYRLTHSLRSMNDLPLIVEKIVRCSELHHTQHLAKNKSRVVWLDELDRAGYCLHVSRLPLGVRSFYEICERGVESNILNAGVIEAVLSPSL